MPPLPRGTCQVCHTEIAFRKDGRFRSHRIGGANFCRGSGKYPADRPKLADNDVAKAQILVAAAAAPSKRKRQLAEEIGYHRRELNALLATDPDYADEFREAKGYGAQQLEDRLKELIFGANPSSRLVGLALRAWHPDFKEVRRIEHGNADGKPFKVATPTFDPETLSDDELATLEALFSKARPQTPHEE